MKSKILFAAAALWAAFSLPASAQQPSGIYNATPPTLSDKQQAPFQFDASANLKTTSSSMAATSGGGTPVKYLSAATTNATSVKGSAGQLYVTTAINTTTTIYYLKFYDKATAPTCGTDTPVQTYPIPSGAAGNGLIVPVAVGMSFAAGIGFCLTAGIADADTAAAATGVAISLVYK